MRYTTSLAKVALALVLPFILAHCASLLSDRLPLTYDEKSVGGPNSSAPLQLWLPPGNGPFPAVLVMHSCSGITDSTPDLGGSPGRLGLRRGDRRQFRATQSTRRLRERRLHPDYRTCAGRPQRRDLSAHFAQHPGRPDRDRWVLSRWRGDLLGRDRRTHPSRPRRPSVSGGSHLLPPMFRREERGAVCHGRADPDRQGRHWTPADLCLKTVAARANQAHPLAIKVYPGALHSFDLGSLPVVTSSGHMVGGNPEAAADSFVMTKAFLDARLKVK